MSIHRKYKFIHKIGSGCFGTIYKGQNIRTGEFVAIKVEPTHSEIQLLLHEASIYPRLKGCYYVPELKWVGKDEYNHYMVLTLLGPSLYGAGPLSLSLVFKIGTMVLLMLKSMHDRGLVHRDLKPQNILLPLNCDISDTNHLFLVDFGFCTWIRENSEKKTHNTIGSKNYASIHSHNHMELSKRDDVESLFYILLYLYRGSLPWHQVKNESEIVFMKQRIIYDTEYPAVLLECVHYAQCMEYHESPNYFYLIHKLQ